MRVHFLPFAIAALAVLPAWGQNAAAPASDKVFHFANINTELEFRRMDNTIRSITNITQTSVNAPAKTLTVRGTASQLSTAEWLFRELDQPAAAPHAASKLELVVPQTSNDLLAMVWLAHTPTPQGVQEIINAVRSVAEIQRLAGYNPHGALVMRGSAAQVAFAEWLIEALDKPADGAPYPSVGLTLTASEFNLRDIATVARIYYPAYLANAQQLIESTNMLRSIAEIMRVVPCISSGAIVVRGFPDEIALADWLLNGLANPAVGEGPRLLPYFNPGVNRGVTRMFYVSHYPSPEALQTVATAVRNQANLQRIATHSGAHAIAVRGTPEQVTRAEGLIRQMDTTP